MLDFLKSKPEAAASAVARIGSKLEQARQELEEARRRHGAAALAVEDGADGAAAELQRAGKALDAARGKVDALEAAYREAEARHAAVQADLTGQHEAAAWERAVELARKRETLAAEIEKTASAFAAQYHELMRLSVELHTAAPVRDDKLNMSLAGPNRTEAGIRNHLAARDLPWAATTRAIPAIDFPTLGSVVADGNAAILSRRPSTTEE